MPDWDDTPPVARDLSAPPDNSAAVPIGTPPNPLLAMPAAFAPAFVELTGSAAALDQLQVNSSDENRILQGTVGGRLKTYQVRAGNDATALPGIVRPANFADPANAYIFVQL